MYDSIPVIFANYVVDMLVNIMTRLKDAQFRNQGPVLGRDTYFFPTSVSWLALDQEFTDLLLSIRSPHSEVNIVLSCVSIPPYTFMTWCLSKHKESFIYCITMMKYLSWNIPSHSVDRNFFLLLWNLKVRHCIQESRLHDSVWDQFSVVATFTSCVQDLTEMCRLTSDMNSTYQNKKIYSVFFFSLRAALSKTL
jgi:hypothetical protein